MKERPILFRGPMVLAVLAGAKTQTRRIVKGQVPAWNESAAYRDHCLKTTPCPYGLSGDRLWVRETYIRGGNGKPVHCADADPNELGLAWKNGFRKTPSIFMRRWESRITLEVVSVRVERLNAISAEDAKAEGIEFREGLGFKFYGKQLEKLNQWTHTPAWSYESLWESINGVGSWARNPWVWVIEFKKV